MSMPDIQTVMTPMPHSIEAGANLVEAQNLMQSQGIRHLPVTRDGELVGLLSDRDLRRSFDPMVDMPPLLPVGDVMVDDDLYIVPAEAPLDEVLETLAKRRIGCALIRGESGLSGIFTTTDATRMLAEHLRELHR
ncbi:hypothetical protein ABI59_11245 [Acidobacteria bacterium Mor1]|nr:hypothetical protein ABI59_11245 [Acidobacteria bacterium Mor1]